MFMHGVARMGIDGVIADTRRIVGDSSPHLSFDIDSLDEAFAPGTDTPGIARQSAFPADSGSRTAHAIPC
jgi:guanidinopropionase